MREEWRIGDSNEEQPDLETGSGNEVADVLEVSPPDPGQTQRELREAAADSVEFAVFVTGCEGDPEEEKPAKITLETSAAEESRPEETEDDAVLTEPAAEDAGGDSSTEESPPASDDVAERPIQSLAGPMVERYFSDKDVGLEFEKAVEPADQPLGTDPNLASVPDDKLHDEEARTDPNQTDGSETDNLGSVAVSGAVGLDRQAREESEGEDLSLEGVGGLECESASRIPELLVAQYLTDSEAVLRENPEATEAETRLFEEFESLVEGLDISEIAQAYVDPETHEVKPIEDIGKFRLVPLISGDREDCRLWSPGVIEGLPREVKVTYEEVNDDGELERLNPYTDASQAIGLVHDNRLVAMGGAGIVHGKERILILELQDVTGERMPKRPRARDIRAEAEAADAEEGEVRERIKAAKEAYSGAITKYLDDSPLRAGLDWRATLVKAWEELGKELGVRTITIQPNQKSQHRAIRQAGDKGFNDVAERMGYDPPAEDDEDGVWTKTV